MIASLEPIPLGRNVNMLANVARGIIVIVDIKLTSIPKVLKAIKNNTPFKIHITVVNIAIMNMVFLLLYLMNDSWRLEENLIILFLYFLIFLINENIENIFNKTFCVLDFENRMK